MHNSKIIKEIAQNLTCGEDSYYNYKTEELVTIPNASIGFDEEEFQEIFKDDLEKIAKHKADFIKIEVLESFQSYKLMELFIDQLPEIELKQILKNVIQKKKSFQRFKHHIDASTFRESWFEFQQNELEKIVAKELENAIRLKKL
ncbi:Uncharacterised protein family (UPF0158) [Polaribacter sp. KT25b]|uniref:UPF0158 family protein n=1 Tax=Polaribacter sp. KT25b TaxID=1855336 RepID=UPI000879FEC1|nr:UPF0158 family protein [Polaribacter sp. KT25b]SDR74712.1 Uncharacterised protein family (UPF0158) [Polaribacter sp. KT25b]